MSREILAPRDRIDVEGCARKSGPVVPPDRAVPVRARALPMTFFARGKPTGLRKIPNKANCKVSQASSITYLTIPGAKKSS